MFEKDETIRSTTNINNFGSYLDQNPLFQEKIKIILQNGHAESKLSIPSETTFLKIFVYCIECPCIQSSPKPAMLLIGLPENPITTKEKEMNWGIKACFKETKYDRL